VTALQAQLTELQEARQEETRQKLASQSRQRQVEEDATALREQLEEEEQSRKQLESKILLLTTQVNFFLFTFRFIVRNEFVFMLRVCIIVLVEKKLGEIETIHCCCVI